MGPIELTANSPRSFYRGAGRIAAFRGLPPPPDEYYPEDWVASTTSRFRRDPAGQSPLPDGRLLAAAVAEDPVGWLGAEHADAFGADPGLLVKLLDAGQRLPLHVHPNRDFARSHLASPYGKTEAWVVVSAVSDAGVHLGFARDVGADELATWVREQDVEGMLAATHRVPVAAGDAILCPAGVPHAIGSGVLLVELQEPTDFSVLLEWTGFDIDGSSEGHLGMGFDTALQCVDRGAWDPDRLAELGTLRRRARAVRPGVTVLFPEAADPYFVAERLQPDPHSELDAGFSVLVVVDGAGQLDLSAGGRLPVRAGQTFVLPHAAGPGTLTGAVTAIRCRPPAQPPAR